MYARQENFVGEEKKHHEKDDILTEVKVAKRSKVEKEGENNWYVETNAKWIRKKKQEGR